MGLIKAIFGATGGVLADQWKEYFYCDALPADVICARGHKKTSGRSSNTKGDDNIITQGSVIAVADGQCMLIVEQGKVVDVCAEPGEYNLMPLQNQVFLQAALDRGLQIPLRILASVLPLAAKLQKHRRFTI